MITMKSSNTDTSCWQEYAMTTETSYTSELFSHKNITLCHAYFQESTKKTNSSDMKILEHLVKYNISVKQLTMCLGKY